MFAGSPFLTHEDAESDEFVSSGAFPGEGGRWQDGKSTEVLIQKRIPSFTIQIYYIKVCFTFEKTHLATMLPFKLLLITYSA